MIDKYAVSGKAKLVLLLKGALTTGDSLIAVVSIENESDSSSYRMCAQFDAPDIKSIAGGTGIKVKSKTSSLPTVCPQ